MSKAGKRVLASARQALAFARGEADTREFKVHVSGRIDMRVVRRKIGLSQVEFARPMYQSVRSCLPSVVNPAPYTRRRRGKV